MKLITQTLLLCNKKGCTVNNFPLKLIPSKVELYQDAALMAYSKPLMQRLLQKLDLGALNLTLNELEWADVKPLFLDDQETAADPEQANLEALSENEDFLTNLWEITCRRHVTEGQLICRNCGRQYDIKNGIVNMLLNEDEV